MATSSTTTTSSGAGRNGKDASAKAVVADQITQSVQSTSNLLHLMLQSSPSQAKLRKLPKSLLAKTSTIKNTSLVLEQLPRIISSLDAHMDEGLQCVPQLETVIQLLSNIENSKVKSLSSAQLPPKSCFVNAKSSACSLCHEVLRLEEECNQSNNGVNFELMKMVLDLDLNAPPRVEDLSVMDTASDVNTNLELGLPQVQVMANIDAGDDDDVLICSPRSFAEAKEKARRNCPVIEVLDDETEAHQGSPGLICAGRNTRRRDSRRNGANIVCIDLEASEKCKSKDYIKQHKKVSHPQAAAQPPAPPALSCPVCMAQLVEETSTKCGHIFCKKCIGAAIAAQGKCPTCRRELKAGKDTFRVYLPTSY